MDDNKKQMPINEYCQYLEELTESGSTVNAKGLQKWIEKYAENYHLEQMQTKRVNKTPIHNKKSKELKTLVLEEYKKGNIVIASGVGGLCTAPLKEIIKQPVDGLLYDINRNEATILTFINDPKWINDYASTQIIRALKNQVNELKENHATAKIPPTPKKK
jgi:hypothetical protein